MKIRSLVGCAALASALVLNAGSAHAIVVAADSFCATGSLLNQSSGVGFSDVWQTSNQYQNAFVVQAGALPVGASGLTTYGGSLNFDATGLGNGARIYRPLDLSAGSPAGKAGLVEMAQTFFGNQQAALGVPGTTVWIGLLANGSAAMGNQDGYDTQTHLFLGVNKNQFNQGDFNKDGESLAIGRGNQNHQWNVETTCSHTVCGPGQTGGFLGQTLFGDGKTHWAVLRFKFTANGTDTTMWIDPTPGANDPADASAQVGPVNLAAFHFNWIELGGAPDAQAGFDEYVIATTFADLSTGGQANCGGASSSSTSASSTAASTAASTSGMATSSSTSGAGGATTGPTSTSGGPGSTSGGPSGPSGTSGGPSGTSGGPGVGPTGGFTTSSGAGGANANNNDPGDTSGCPCNLAKSQSAPSSPASVLALSALIGALVARRRAKKS